MIIEELGAIRACISRLRSWWRGSGVHATCVWEAFLEPAVVRSQGPADAASTASGLAAAGRNPVYVLGDCCTMWIEHKRSGIQGALKRAVEIRAEMLNISVLPLSLKYRSFERNPSTVRLQLTSVAPNFCNRWMMFWYCTVYASLSVIKTVF